MSSYVLLLQLFTSAHVVVSYVEAPNFSSWCEATPLAVHLPDGDFKSVGAHLGKIVIVKFLWKQQCKPALRALYHHVIKPPQSSTLGLLYNAFAMQIRH